MSSSSRGNLAVTKDGEPYNKLRRPEDFGASTCPPPPPSSKVVPSAPPAADSNKRKQENADVTEDDEQDVKRSKQQHGTPKIYDHKNAHKHVHPGVQSTFLGIDDSDNDSADSTTNEALAYLRSVRSEASAIPSLLVAPPAALADDEPDRSMYTSGRGDHSVIYRDGAWIAVDRDDEEEEYWSDEQCDLDPQEEYYKQLLRRYNALRNTLARLDHREFAKMRDADPERFANQKPPQSRHWWLHTLDREYPTPAQVAQIDQRTLYQGLQFCTHSLDRFDTISQQKSCWIWTLLALAGEIGTLDNPKVGQIRDLGHKAGQLRIRLRGGSIRRLREEEYEDKEDGDASGVDLNTKATIDMILTVVAECYRQKDLLKYRELWGE